MATAQTAKLQMVRRNYHGLAETLRGLEVDLRWGLEDSTRIPAAWHDIAREPVVPVKEKVTLRLDTDVAAFFRATGAGHLTRINRVLRAYMLARLADVVKGAEAVSYQPTDMERYLTGAAEVIEMTMLYNAKARAGQDVVALDVEIARKTAELRVLEEAMGLPEEGRVLPPH
jgi:hypothetical protein